SAGARARAGRDDRAGAGAGIGARVRVGARRAGRPRRFTRGPRPRDPSPRRARSRRGTHAVARRDRVVVARARGGWMSTRPELLPGERYGEFEIVELLGRGAFAAVYRVRAPGRDPAALKLSLRPVGDRDESRRALREIAVLRTLTNHHVVRVHEAGQGADGRAYILMDY